MLSLLFVNRTRSHLLNRHRALFEKNALWENTVAIIEIKTDTHTPRTLQINRWWWEIYFLIFLWFDYIIQLEEKKICMRIWLRYRKIASILRLQNNIEKTVKCLVCFNNLYIFFTHCMHAHKKTATSMQMKQKQ